jgi:hypothetical protein
LINFYLRQAAVVNIVTIYVVLPVDKKDLIKRKKKLMKPKEIKPSIVYRIIDRKTEDAVGSYSRSYCDEFDFNSVSEARNANCHGVFENREKYKIAKYRVTYTLIESDCDRNEKI